MRRLSLALLLVAACTTRATGDWIGEPVDGSSARSDPGWRAAGGATSAAPGEPGAAAPAPDAEAAGADEAPVLIREHGRAAPRGRPRASPATTQAPDVDGLFRNTYYDFPSEGAGAKDSALFDASCRPIGRVTTVFHDQVCVQGSGRIATGATVSFARRDCECASVCPRTGQRICFEALDPVRFPYGRGATGGPITPLRTVAVDSDVIPLGTVIFVPELVGLPRAGGGRHDGCFVAEDRGIKVVGKQIDVFTGDPSMTARYNALFPSNRGVHVRLGEPRCARLGQAADPR